MNKYRSLGVYLNGRKPVRVIVLKTFSSEAVVEDELWGLNTSNNPYFSKNDQYKECCPIRNFEREIFIYHLPSKKIMILKET